MPACLPIHKGSISPPPGVQRVGLGQPQAPHPEAPGPATAQEGGLQSQCLELFSLVMSFNKSLYAAPNPYRGHSVQGHAGSDYNWPLSLSCFQDSALLRESEICFRLSEDDR